MPHWVLITLLCAALVVALIGFWRTWREWRRPPRPHAFEIKTLTPRFRE